MSTGHRRTRQLLAGALILLGATSHGARADVRLDWRGGNVGVIIEGEITVDTRFEISWGQFEVRQRNCEVVGYVLNSPGGNVEASEGIAYDIRNSRLPVLLLSGARCISACFALLAAAYEKYIAPDAVIAIHSAVTPGVGEDPAALAATMEIARSAAFDGIPDDIIGRLVRTPAGSISVLSLKEIVRIPRAHVSESVPFATFTQNAKPVDKYWAGYAAGAYIAAGKSDFQSCAFVDPRFQVGCLDGLRDAPPKGWAKGFFLRQRGNE